jgi:hypothetical protein
MVPLRKVHANLGDRLMSGVGPELGTKSTFSAERRTRRKAKPAVFYHWNPDLLAVKQAPETQWSLPTIVGATDRSLLTDSLLHGMHNIMVRTHGLLSGADAARDSAVGVLTLPLDGAREVRATSR